MKIGRAHKKYTNIYRFSSAANFELVTYAFISMTEPRKIKTEVNLMLSSIAS